MNQLALQLDVVAPVMTHSNVFDTGINLHCFGRGFPWKVSDYNDFGKAAAKLKPYMECYGLSRATIPDFRGVNALVSNGKEDFLKILESPPMYKTTRAVDALELKNKISAFAITADCSIALVVDRVKHRAFLAHCGRDSLHPLRKNGKSRSSLRESVISSICRELMTPATTMSQVHVLGICGIAAKSFPNKASFGDGFHGKVVKYFSKNFGRDVVQGDLDEGNLSIPQIVRLQFRQWGVPIGPQGNISWDSIDTATDARFYSRRRGDIEGCNCVLVDMEHAFE